MADRIPVELTEPQLRAVVAVVGPVVSETCANDEEHPLLQAEHALDGALLAHEGSRIAEADDEGFRARATCSQCLARTYRQEECACEDGGDAEDYDLIRGGP